MLSTLRSISQPLTSPLPDISRMPKTSNDVDDIPVESEDMSPMKKALEMRQEGSGNEEKGLVGNELKTVDSQEGETTEDEMDEDAVLLKRPAET